MLWPFSFSSFRLPREESDNAVRSRRRGKLLLFFLLFSSLLLLAASTQQQGFLLRAQISPGGGRSDLRPLTATAKLLVSDLPEGAHTLEAVLEERSETVLARDTKIFNLTAGQTACLKLALENAGERGNKAQEHRAVRVRVRQRSTKAVLAETVVRSAGDGTVTIADQQVVNALGPDTDVFVKPRGYLGRVYGSGQALLSGCPSGKGFLLNDLTEDGKLDQEDIRAALRAFRKKPADTVLHDTALHDVYPEGVTLRGLVTTIRRVVQGPPEDKRDED